MKSCCFYVFYYSNCSESCSAEMSVCDCMEQHWLHLPSFLIKCFVFPEILVWSVYFLLSHKKWLNYSVFCSDAVLKSPPSGSKSALYLQFFQRPCLIWQISVSISASWLVLQTDFITQLMLKPQKEECCHSNRIGLRWGSCRLALSIHSQKFPP